MRRSIFLAFAFVFPMVGSAAAKQANMSAIESIRSDDAKSADAWDLNSLGVLTQLGVQLGPNATNASLSSTALVPDANGRTRMTFGMNATIGLGTLFGGMFYVQPELNFVQRGFDQPIIEQTTRSNLEVSLNYLELPLLLKVRPKLEIPKIRPYAVLGPSLAMLTSATAQLTTRDANGQTSVAEHDAGDYRTFALNMNLGAGAEFELSDVVALSASLRYIAGLTNLASRPDESGEVRTLKQNAVQVLAGVQFAL